MTSAIKEAADRSLTQDPSMLYMYFRVQSLRCCLPAVEVERVADIGQINGLPRLPSFILGICSERGRVLTVIDAAELLGARKEAPSALLPRLLVLKVDGGNLALQVDAVEGIRLGEPAVSEDPGEAEEDPTPPLTLTLQTLLEKLEMVAA